MELITAQCLENFPACVNVLLQFLQSPLGVRDKEYNRFPLDIWLKEK